jgi:serine protease
MPVHFPPVMPTVLLVARAVSHGYTPGLHSLPAVLMRIPVRNLPALRAVLVVALVFPAYAQTVAAAADARVIVKFKHDATILKVAPAGIAPQDARADALAKRLGVSLRAGIRVSDRTQVMFAAGMTSQDLARRLSSERDVEYAVPDKRRRAQDVPSDPLYPGGLGGNGPAVGQWYLRAPGGDVQSSIDVEPAWAITTGSPAIVVADLDTGVRFDHPDLLAVDAGGNLLPGYDMISFANSNDGDGRDPDPSDPGDWITAQEANDPGGLYYQCTEQDPSSGRYLSEDSSWHGTQTAGLIAAITDNGAGMASVGRTVRVLPVRVLGKCGGYDSDIIAGMRWAAGLNVPGTPVNTTHANVINMSLGGGSSCPMSYQDVVDEISGRGIVIVASAGNDAGHAVAAPADCRGVIAVAALRHVGTKVGFSNVGPEVTIAAPGGNCVNVAPGTPCLYPSLTTSNSGFMGPLDSIYTDSFDISVGTSFSAPLVSGTVALMLSAQPSLTPPQVKALLQATARPFPTTGADVSSGPVAACTPPQYDASNDPVDQLECYCTTQACGAGMLDAGAAVVAARNGLAIAPVQAQGLWWNAPAGSESGWGINFAQQSDVIFATWFTYDTLGRAWWLSMTATRIADNAYSGTLYQTRGPAFNAVPFNPARVVATGVGSATVSFTGPDDGTFSYTVNGTTQTKSITRQAFGALPTCTWGAQPDLALATNYQDLWWAAPAAAESGWGINLTEQSSIIFATWFTYGLDGTAMWLSMTATSTGPHSYGGQIYRTSGPHFDAVPFRPSQVSAAVVGSGSLTFADGNTGTFAYTVNGVSQSKAITRQVFRAPGTVCQ